MRPSCIIALIFTLGSAIVNAHVLTNTGFPWEGCKQVTDTASYNLSLLSYKELPDKSGSELCYVMHATNTTQCNINMQRYRKKTRCCTAMFNKIKFWPAQQCNRAYRTITLQPRGGAPYQKSWSRQNMPANAVRAYTPRGDTTPPGAYWVVKATPFELTREQANGMTICVTLGAPCPTLKSFAYGGKVLEWLLYDAKKDNYECCVPGITPVLESDYFAGDAGTLGANSTTSTTNSSSNSTRGL